MDERNIDFDLYKSLNNTLATMSRRIDYLERMILLVAIICGLTVIGMVTLT